MRVLPHARDWRAVVPATDGRKELIRASEYRDDDVTTRRRAQRRGGRRRRAGKEDGMEEDAGDGGRFFVDAFWRGKAGGSSCRRPNRARHRDSRSRNSVSVTATSSAAEGEERKGAGGGDSPAAGRLPGNYATRAAPRSRTRRQSRSRRIGPVAWAINDGASSDAAKRQRNRRDKKNGRI
ncbi:hypothetical protein ACHAW5_003342 [Stephanodiscus triporus]|uniref:Uncharacterized protein n=1 Tax=Stephanodiscus triporus TaxID=2934178 RepID=A0ABD3PBY7_9STRA